MNKRLLWMTRVAVLAALGFGLKFFSFPVIPVADWLKLDFGELPALLAALAMGPMAGITVSLITNGLDFLFQATFGGVGQLANFLMGIALCVPAGLIYQRHRTFKRALMGLLVSCLAMVGVAVLANLYLLVPAAGFSAAISKMSFWGMSGMRGYILMAIVPFNLLKGVVLSVLMLLLYKRVAFLLHGKK